MTNSHMWLSYSLGHHWCTVMFARLKSLEWLDNEHSLFFNAFLILQSFLGVNNVEKTLEKMKGEKTCLENIQNFCQNAFLI